MNLDKTQLLADQTRHTLHIYRCPCGTDVDVDPQKGGKCSQCERVIPATVTQMSMTMTFSDFNQTTATRSLGQEESGPDELIGKMLGHFEIIESIGRGGMGQVYRALDTSLQRYVAVKVIHGAARSGLDSQGQARLMYEAVAQARVNHPNIVTIYYVGKESEMSFLAMELIDGYDAADLIKQGEVPYETLCSIAIKITHALDVASQTGIVHADIKPQNLLILTDGNVKLSDFGMARIGEEDQEKLLGGTPNYLAPELFQGGKPSIQSDMYALGVTLFELTFGRLPVALSGTSLKQWSEIHETAQIKFPEPWPDHLPERWKKVLQRLLEKDPDKRHPTYEELGQELRSILPVKRPQARLVPRSIAWGIDMVTIGFSVIIPVGILAIFGISIPDNLDNAAMLPSLVLYMALIYWWRQSLGRELVHVKIVNRYSLKPTRKVMLLREFMRMQVLWMVAIGGLFGLLISGIDVLFAGIGFLAATADVLYTATVGRGQSLHDRFTHTQAVVGSDTN